MVFSSVIFLFRFLPIFMLLYFMTPKRMRNIILFFGSLFFYAWGEPIYVCLMLFSTISDYTWGRLIENARVNHNSKNMKTFLIISILINLLVLC